MAIEAGGKNGIFPVDDLTREYMKEHSKRPFTEYEADSDAEYDEEYTIDLSTLKSTVSFPHLPDNIELDGRRYLKPCLACSHSCCHISASHTCREGS